MSFRSLLTRAALSAVGVVAVICIVWDTADQLRRKDWSA